jgi:indole-3-glycerol phosphate synthase
MSFLQRIIADKLREVSNLRSTVKFEILLQQARETPNLRSFRKAITRPNEISLIAEIKKASPSKGLIREDFDPIKIAEDYETAGAAAISVLTETQYFLGDPRYLAVAKEHSTRPLLRKDFLVDPIQIPESRILGADAILLIVAALEPRVLADLLSLARELSLDALVEVHDESELKTALEAGADLIGINNRNLDTFEVHLQTTFDLLPKIPNGIATVSESGISSHLDVNLLRDVGVDAVLVGEAFMRSNNVRAAVHKLMGW